MKTKLLSGCLTLLLSTMSLMAAELINCNLGENKPIIIGKNKIQISGAENGFLALGKKGLSLPVRGLMKESGTVFAKVKVLPIKEAKLIPRYLVTLRTGSRLTASLVLFGDSQVLQFGFGDRAKQFYHRFAEKMEFNREYALAFTYDGSSVKIYIDGKMAAEYPQPLPVKAEVRNINLGPYKDGWQATKLWADDTLFSQIRVWDTPLSPEEIAKLSQVKFSPLPKTHPAILTIPACHGPAPVIDGELSDKAWKYAAGMPRLIYGNFPKRSGSLPPHNFKFTYDKNNLYCSFTTLFPGGSPLQKGNIRTKEQEPEVWGSESFELYLSLNNTRYRFAGNLAGGTTEHKGADAKWDGAWQYKSTLKMQIDDSMLWSGEIAIPWSTLGLNGVPEIPVSFNFCRSWKLPNTGTHSSLNWNGKTYSENFVPLKFGDTPALQILSQSDPANGEYTQDIALSSIKGGKMQYVLALAKMDGSALPLELFHRKFTLKPGEYFTEKITNKITAFGYDCLLYTLLDNRGKAVMRQAVPFQLSEDYLELRKLFLQEKLVVQLKDAMLKAKFGNNYQLDISLLDSTNSIVYKQSAKDSGQCIIPFKRNFKAGKYTLELRNRRDNKVLNTKTFVYPGIGEWEKIKFDNRIIPPFTPMQTQFGKGKLSAKMWNRHYTWHNSLFPAAIESSQTPVLSAPVALEINGKLVVNGTVASGKIAPHRAEFSAKSDIPELSIVNNGFVEYDGVNWNEVALTAKKELKQVRIKVVLPKKLAKYIHASGTGNWASQTTDFVGDKKRTLSFQPVVWLGMEDKGICFFAESRKSWKSPNQKSYTIEPAGNDQMALCAELAPVLKAGETLKFSFGLLASPVRPRPANYPLNTFGWSYCVPLNRPGRTPASAIVYINNPTAGDLGSFFGDQDTPEGRSALSGNRKVAKRSLAFGALPIPYACARYLSIRYPEMAAFKDEWEILPEIAMDYSHNGHFVYDCCPTTGANNFFVLHAYNMLKNNPEFRGIYFDFGTHGECNNPHHGCDSRFPLLGMREFYRRIAVAQLMAGIKEPVIVAHNTDKLMLPIFTFVTHLLNGERVRQASSSLLHNKKDILDSYGLPMFACELASLPFGITNSVYMPCDKLQPRFGGDEEDAPYRFRMTKAVMAGTLIHNTMPCLWRLHHGIFDKIIRIYEEFGVPQAEFKGYWNNPVKVSGAEDIYVSLFVDKAGKKALAVVAHLGKPHVNQEFQLNFDWKKLGMTPPSKAVDKMTAPDPDYEWLATQSKQQKVPAVRAPLELGDFGSKIRSFDGKTLKMSLAYHSFALIELQ